jgi:hypothetical protein
MKTIQLQTKVITVLFLVLSLIMPNVKFYFLLSALYILTLFFINRSWEKTVVFGYLPLAVYFVGQLYVFRVIQPEELNHPLYPDGRSLYFKFTPLLVMGVAMVVSWLVKLMTIKFRTNWLIVILLVVVGLNMVSVMSNQVLPLWTILGSLTNDLALVIWIWWTMFYLGKASEIERKFFWKFLMNLFKAVLIIGAVLVLAQGLKGSGLGLVVEQSEILPFSNSGSDEGGWLNRPIGIWTHANEAAYYLMTYFMAWLLIKIRFDKKRDGLLGENWMFIPLASVIWLQSRSVFIGLVPMSIWWICFYFRRIKSRIKTLRLGGIRLFLVLAGMFLGSVVVVNRFWNSVTNFGESSGWVTRTGLISVALRLVSHNFWWGIGKGNFIPVAFREDTTRIMKSFPESVHNGWILILVEQGFWGLLFWILFVGLLFVLWWKRKSEARFWWLLVSCFSANLLVMVFQPFSFILMPEIIVCMLLLADESENV